MSLIFNLVLKYHTSLSLEVNLNFKSIYGRLLASFLKYSQHVTSIVHIFYFFFILIFLSYCSALLIFYFYPCVCSSVFGETSSSPDWEGNSFSCSFGFPCLLLLFYENLRVLEVPCSPHVPSTGGLTFIMQQELCT